MKIWLDTTNIAAIGAATDLGVLFGVTTNPELAAQSGKSLEDLLQSLLDAQEGPVTAQVVACNTQEMVRQGQTLNAFSARIIVKIPVTQDGLKAIHLLSEQNIPTMATVIFQPHQALMAALAGADYAAPYLGQIEQRGQNPWDVLTSISQMFQHYKLKTEILAASLRSLEYVQKCAEMGISNITVKEPLFRQMIATVPATQEKVDHFAQVWEAAHAMFV